MKIVPLAEQKEFISELALLHHAEWNHLNPSRTLGMQTEAIVKAAESAGIPSIFIATSGNILIGSAAVVHQDMDTKPDLSPWLAAVYVKEDFRHQGVATELIARCENEALQSGAKIWYLYTEFAHKLYEKLGWHHMEHCEYKGIMVNVMYKQIVP